MASAAQVQDLAFDYQRGISDVFAALDRLDTLFTYYAAFDLANDDSFPVASFNSTSLEGRVDRGTFRDIVTNANALVAALDGTPGRRFVMSKILDGVPG